MKKSRWFALINLMLILALVLPGSGLAVQARSVEPEQVAA